MSALPPLNWQRVSSCEDNSVLLILCISAGEFNHLPALFTCHLNDETNPALCYKFSIDVHANCQSAGWLISFSLDAKAFVHSIAIAPRRWHTAGDPRCCSSGSDAAHCYFGSRLSFSRFCALAHAANAPKSHSSGSAPDSSRLSHDVRCSVCRERCILGAGCRADHRALSCDLAGGSLRADRDALLFRRATLCLGRCSDCYCRCYIVGCCVRPMSLAHQASNQAMQRTAGRRTANVHMNSTVQPVAARVVALGG